MFKADNIAVWADVAGGAIAGEHPVREVFGETHPGVSRTGCAPTKAVVHRAPVFTDGICTVANALRTKADSVREPRAPR